MLKSEEWLMDGNTEKLLQETLEGNAGKHCSMLFKFPFSECLIPKKVPGVFPAPCFSAQEHC